MKQRNLSVSRIIVLSCLTKLMILNRVYLSFYLKYVIYKPREVNNPIKKRVRKHEFLNIIFHEVYKSHILNRMIQ